MKTMTLNGRRAAGGVAEGRPVVITSIEDLHKVEQGDVLVVAQTDIEFVPAMLRSVAVITETGGRFCHAAVWARENNKPTVLQVSGATTLLADVSHVRVDATTGIVTWELPA